MCLECHGPKSPNGPHAAASRNTRTTRRRSAGSECVACHMPKIAQTIADVNVRSHTFRFITPAQSETYKIPNACVMCHKDKSNVWASQQLKGWRIFRSGGWLNKRMHRRDGRSPDAAFHSAALAAESRALESDRSPDSRPSVSR